MVATTIARLRQWRPRWFLWDPPGMIIAGFAWCIMAAALLAIWTSISRWVGLFSPLGLLSAVWFAGLLGMCMWSHVTVMTTNPATVPASLSGIAPGAKQDAAPDTRETVTDDGTTSHGSDGEEEEFEEEEVEMPLHEFESREDDGTLLLFCDECGIYRPSRAQHCSTCACCIVLHDHHCPWVNNCVGIGNHKAFLLLLLYVTVTSVHVGLFMLTQRLLCTGSACGFGDAQVPGRIGLWTLAGACVFGFFCSLMGAMELYSIYLESLFTVIADQITCRSGSKSRSRLERHLSVICGTNGFDTSWLVPTAPQRSRHERAIVHGFRSGDYATELC